MEFSPRSYFGHVDWHEAIDGPERNWNSPAKFIAQENDLKTEWRLKINEFSSVCSLRETHIERFIIFCIVSENGKTTPKQHTHQHSPQLHLNICMWSAHDMHYFGTAHCDNVQPATVCLCVCGRAIHMRYPVACDNAMLIKMQCMPQCHTEENCIRRNAERENGKPRNTKRRIALAATTIQKAEEDGSTINEDILTAFYSW